MALCRWELELGVSTAAVPVFAGDRAYASPSLLDGKGYGLPEPSEVTIEARS